MKIELHVDPQGKYVEHTPEQLVEWCGLLPHFVMNPEYFNVSALESIEAQYQYGSGYYMDGWVTEDGTYEYPEDEPLAPLMTIRRDGSPVHIYPYGIIYADGKIQRMD